MNELNNGALLNGKKDSGDFESKLDEIEEENLENPNAESRNISSPIQMQRVFRTATRSLSPNVFSPTRRPRSQTVTQKPPQFKITPNSLNNVISHGTNQIRKSVLNFHADKNKTVHFTLFPSRAETLSKDGSDMNKKELASEIECKSLIFHFF